MSSKDLTLDNILPALQRVRIAWPKLADVLKTEKAVYEKIIEGSKDDENKGLRLVLRHWLDNDPNASWDVLSKAVMCLSMLKPFGSRLYSEYVTEDLSPSAMCEEVKDIVEGWFQLGYMLLSSTENVNTAVSGESEEEKRISVVDYWLKFDTLASWELLARRIEDCMPQHEKLATEIRQKYVPVVDIFRRPRSPSPALDTELTVKTTFEATQGVEDWYALGWFLKLDDDKLEDIEKISTRNDLRREAVLRAWLEKDASWVVLADALRHMPQHVGKSETVRRKYCKPAATADLIYALSNSEDVLPVVVSACRANNVINPSEATNVLDAMMGSLKAGARQLIQVVQEFVVFSPSQLYVFLGILQEKGNSLVKDVVKRIEHEFPFQEEVESLTNEVSMLREKVKDREENNKKLLVEIQRLESSLQTKTEKLAESKKENEFLQGQLAEKNKASQQNRTVKILSNRKREVLFLTFILGIIYSIAIYGIVEESESLSINKAVTGGIADVMQWPDSRFKMNIPVETFPSGQHVDITASLLVNFHCHQIPKGYKLVSPTYQVTASEKLQKPVMFTVKHNAIISNNEEAHSLAILHQMVNGSVEVLNGTAAPNSSYIMFHLSELSNITIIGPEDSRVRYYLTFHRNLRQKSPNHKVWSIRTCASLENQACKFEGWIPDPDNSKNEELIAKGHVTLELKPVGCWEHIPDQKPAESIDMIGANTNSCYTSDFRLQCRSNCNDDTYIAFEITGKNKILERIHDCDLKNSIFDSLYNIVLFVKKAIVLDIAVTIILSLICLILWRCDANEPTRYVIVLLVFYWLWRLNALNYVTFLLFLAALTAMGYDHEKALDSVSKLLQVFLNRPI